MCRFVFDQHVVVVPVLVAELRELGQERLHSDIRAPLKFFIYFFWVWKL